MIVPYDIPRRCAATYYPETNPLVPLRHVADGSNQPASKSIVITLAPAAVVPEGATVSVVPPMTDLPQGAAS
jgi:formate dehydrogenase major subunit